MTEESRLTRRIEPLTADQGRDQFACGKKPLDDYLKNLAIRSMKIDTGRTFVLVCEPSPIVYGYYTIAMSSIAREDIPGRIHATYSYQWQLCASSLRRSNESIPRPPRLSWA